MAKEAGCRAGKHQESLARLSDVMNQNDRSCPLVRQRSSSKEAGVPFMQFERITVRSRDEYREAEEPYGFDWGERRFEIACILDRWYEGHLDARRMPLRYFKVKTSEGEEYILRYHELFRAWSLLVTDQPAGAERDEDS